jgi:hypothetical protein
MSGIEQLVPAAVALDLAAPIEDADGRRGRALGLLHACRRTAGADAELCGAVERWLERLR